jgi:hypothetical protein
VVFHPARCVLTRSGLSKEWYGGKGCDLHGLCLVLLESAKVRFLGVDPPELSVPPRVWYGMTCLLISETSEDGLARRMVKGTSWLPDKPTWCKMGLLWETIALQEGHVVGNLSKSWAASRGRTL